MLLFFLCGKILRGNCPPPSPVPTALHMIASSNNDPLFVGATRTESCDLATMHMLSVTIGQTQLSFKIYKGTEVSAISAADGKRTWLHSNTNHECMAYVYCNKYIINKTRLGEVSIR